MTTKDLVVARLKNEIECIDKNPIEKQYKSLYKLNYEEDSKLFVVARSRAEAVYKLDTDQSLISGCIEDNPDKTVEEVIDCVFRDNIKMVGIFSVSPKK